VAQFGSALDWGSRGRGFKSRQPDLYPRAHPAFDAFGGDGSDELGNGTFVAGIIGGKGAGVAKKTQLFSVKVLDGQGAGSLEGIIAGIEWITKNAQRPAVAHVSIGVPPNDLLDDAVRASIASGVTYVIEASGDATDTDNDSPARVREAVTVGASDHEDHVANFSNYGAALDLFAPGVNITSDVSGGSQATMSGVQYASAHTAGAAALALGKHRNLSPKCVEHALVDASVSSLSGVPADTPNRLLQVPGSGSSTSLSCDALPPPVADAATHEVN
jgi:aqualysin-1